MRRRHQYRTWEELSGPERRRGLAILAVVGVAAVTTVYLVVGGGDPQAAAGAPSPPRVALALAGAGSGATASQSQAAAQPPQPRSPTDQGQLDAWYAGTAQLRGEVVTAVGVVRADIQAANGLELRPACQRLGMIIDGVPGAGAPPVTSTAGQTWNAGAAAYAQAVSTCGNLFDGTPLPPTVLLARTTEALNTADGHWARLAAQIGAPAQIIPANGQLPAR
ncbi:hypothetical protein MXD61_15395 [Frankia sp. AgPm24]|uniref:hypothetical protein n=1 Tax=Frankia sp. AgPm24 TaxID=631128 RepID=UPI00200F2C57|nr:hypothetical protein [Frankia sp. AgPm24]MCK9923239.1 hypothetical protein [Frankia sp. AgPm24]